MRIFRRSLSLGVALFLGTSVAQADDLQTPQKTPAAFCMKLEGGAAYRRMFALPQSGADFALSGGLQTSKSVAFFADVGLFVGKTESLPTQQFRLGLTVDGHYGRFHGGGGARLSIMQLRRVTTGEGYRDLGVGVHAFVALDLVRIDERALYLSGSFSLDLYALYSNLLMGPFVWGPTGALGVRF